MPNVAYDLTRRYTIDEVMAFPEDGNRYELIDGELFVSPTPRISHQRIVMALTLLFGDYLKRFNQERTLFGVGGDLELGPATLVIPDLFITLPDEHHDSWKTVKNLRLAVEVISPGSKNRDRFKKRIVYQKARVETYWIVDPYEQQIEVWTPGADIHVVHTDTVNWHAASGVDPLVIDIQRLWK